MFHQQVFCLITRGISANQIKLIESLLIKNGAIVHLNQYEKGSFILAKHSEAINAFLEENKISYSNQLASSDCISIDWVSQCIRLGQKLPTTHFLLRTPVEQPEKRLKTLSKTSSSSSVEVIIPNYVCQRKSTHQTPNEGTAQLLLWVAKCRKLQGDIRRAEAYERAAATLRACSHLIDSFEKASSLPDVGTRIAEQIALAAVNGTLPEKQLLEQDERLQVLVKLTLIYGVGEKTAIDWFNAGVRLPTDALTLPLISVSPVQKLGIQYYNDLIQRIPQSEMTEWGKLLSNQILQHFSSLVKSTQLAGSYLRGLDSSGDIDFIIRLESGISSQQAENFLRSLVAHFENKNIIKCSLGWHGSIHHREKEKIRLPKNDAFGMWTWSGVARLDDHSLHRQLDLVVSSFHAFPFVLLGWTGSKQFERSLRLYAHKERQWHLTHTGLFNAEMKRIEAETEKDIFDYLGLDYILPVDRNA